MLPSSLLITRRWRDRIRPVYAKLSQENLWVAGLLMQTYSDCVGKSKSELNEAVDGLEDLGYDYRYVRGLSALLDRRCQLESKAAIDPVKTRRHVFGIAHKKALPTNPEARQALLLQAASELEVTVEELEEALYRAAPLTGVWYQVRVRRDDVLVRAEHRDASEHEELAASIERGIGQVTGKPVAVEMLSPGTLYDYREIRAGKPLSRVVDEVAGKDEIVEGM